MRVAKGSLADGAYSMVLEEGAALQARVHNRLDLGARNGDCGELRVSFESTHAIYAPLHILFLFKQIPREGDIAPTGEVQCLSTARRWARLSALEGEAFVEAASAMLDDTIR